MSDRLALTHGLEEAGIERGKAEVMATAIARFVEGSVATKAEVERSAAGLKSDLLGVAVDLERAEAALKADIERLRGEMKADSERLRGVLMADIARLDARIDLVEHRLITRLGGLMVVLIGLLFGALHAWPPH
jgi:hypothetical protein